MSDDTEENTYEIDSNWYFAFKRNESLKDEMRWNRRVLKKSMHGEKVITVEDLYQAFKKRLIKELEVRKYIAPGLYQHASIVDKKDDY